MWFVYPVKLPPTQLYLPESRNSCDGRVKAAFRGNLSESRAKPAYLRTKFRFEKAKIHTAAENDSGWAKTKKAHPVSQDELDIIRCTIKLKL
jgi:hypothetical protein